MLHARPYRTPSLWPGFKDLEHWLLNSALLTIEQEHGSPPRADDWFTHIRPDSTSADRKLALVVLSADDETVRIAMQQLAEEGRATERLIIAEWLNHAQQSLNHAPNLDKVVDSVRRNRRAAGVTRKHVIDTIEDFRERIRQLRRPR